jgi:amidohydrolase
MEKSQKLRNDIVETRRFIHENAEHGNDLPVTTQFVVEKLKEMGLEPEEICKSGVVATIKGGKPGKTILLRADMDALPMMETSGLPFSTKTSSAHACGHDMHTSMLLGAARMLLERQDEIQGNVKLMFQPAEEIFVGAQAMLDNGLMTKPNVDAAFDLHVITELPVGCVAYREGYVSSSCDGFKITIIGKGCHGAQPQNGIDPINVGVHLHLALQALISRETPPNETAVLTVCQFEAGTTANRIPETAVMKGTMRTFNKDLRNKLFKRFREIIEYTAKTFGAEIELEILSDVPSIFVNSDMLQDCIGYIKKLDYDFTYNSEYLITASDDFAKVSELVPSVFLVVGARPYEDEKFYPNHNPNVIFNEDCLPLGAAIFAQCAFEWLKENK